MSGTRTSSHAGEVSKPLLRDQEARAAVVGPLGAEFGQEPLVGLRSDGGRLQSGYRL